MFGAMIRVSMLAVAAILIGMAPLRAADLEGHRPAPKHKVQRHNRYPIQPWNWRVAKIRRADRCWHGCLADTGTAFQACLSAHAPTACVSRNDAADRYCLHECRLGGGPLLPLTE
jgi:hypothetical protein